MTIISMRDIEIGRFRNGEWKVRVPDKLHPKNNEPILIEYLPPDSASWDMMLPLIIGNALRSLYANDLHLAWPCIPYLRQDRAFCPGNAISSKIFIENLNSVFDRIYTLQAHSINGGLISLPFRPELDRNVAENAWIIYPDENAPTFSCMIRNDTGTPPWTEAYTFNRRRTRLNKIRNIETGNPEIIFNILDFENIPESSDFIIFDDMMDGGRTCCNTADFLKKHFPKKSITLIVAHAYFSNGLSIFKESGIDKIITTNSCIPLVTLDIGDKFPKLEIHDCFQADR